MTNRFRYRCLIVEDDEDWYPLMQQSLTGALGDTVEIVAVQDAVAAHKARRRGRFHGLSFDLSIPNSAQENISNPEIGEKVYFDTFEPLSAKTILSAYLRTDPGDKARDEAARRNTTSLAKSGSGLSDFTSYTPRLAAQDWAAFMAARLTGRKPEFCATSAAAEHWLCQEWGRDRRAMGYFALYWQEAGKFLPPPLSLFARDLAACLGNVNDQGELVSLDLEALNNLNQFREWLVHLVWTQCVILLRRAGEPIVTRLLEPEARGKPPTPSEVLYRKTDDLENWLGHPALRRAAALASHLNWNEEGRPDFLAAASRVQEWRNKAAHGRPKPDYIGTWSETISDAVLTLMDAAAFWSRAWFYAEPHTDLGRWQGARLMGAAPPWHRHDLGNLSQHPAGQRDSVFQKLWMKKDDTLAASIFDWSPWLTMSPDASTGQPVPWLLTQPVEHSGTDPRYWYAVCLTDPSRLARREVRLEMLFGK